MSDYGKISSSMKSNADDAGQSLSSVKKISFDGVWSGCAYDSLNQDLQLTLKTAESLRSDLDTFSDILSQLEKYKSLVKKYCLENQVYFYGALSGDELTSVFDRGDIAVSSLGCHRIGIYEGSFLKSREYLCRGLPMITSTKIDILSDDFEYCFRVPEDDSFIDIEKIVDYVNDLYKNGRSNVAEKKETQKWVSFLPYKRNNTILNFLFIFLISH